MRQFGLIGYPLGHSYSKGHFSRKFEQEGLQDCRYDNYEIESVLQMAEIIAANPDLDGLNVTIPHKQTVIPLLDEIDPLALEVGAVNTIKIDRSGNQFTLKGFNTDVTGFLRSMENWSLNNSVKALVFGSGGSSLAVKYALNQLDIRFNAVSRKSEENYIAYDEISPEIVLDHLLWINCTPVGMYPEVDRILPLPYDHLSSEHYLVDLIYNPEITRFLSKGIQAGAKVMNGSTMLFEQAEASWNIWSGKQG